ncbi:membrane protein insertion efficiency factor YidD [Micromonospora mirobrigensis]|uniref:membrane protein insertion efficiency factor YidD n=1 Tax=Micromonospora mirobrigensis TaxID=262898 RepID=UPI001FE1E0FE|nr:membrane protein insertion efficiency factor YidD [Micromonospora mirobrigensis]
MSDDDGDERKRDKGCDYDPLPACDIGLLDCDLACCDLGLFSTALTLGAVTAGVTRAPLADRAGRAAILGYRRWLSHRWPGRCRFTPSCSTYGLAAVERYGLAVGGRQAADRVRRCRPEVPRGTTDPLRDPADGQLRRAARSAGPAGSGRVAVVDSPSAGLGNGEGRDAADHREGGAAE